MVEAEPRCARCGGELVAEDRTASFRLAGMVLLLAALALWLWAPWMRAELRYPCAAAATVLGLMLVPRRLCWRCVSCRARFRRRAPPRMFAQGSRPEAEDSDTRGSCSG